MFEKRVLRRIFGLKTEELTEGWRELIHNLYFYRILLRVINWDERGCAGRDV
jgi:hypothetical protein